jgi:excisionase family DNA binding protein
MNEVNLQRQRYSELPASLPPRGLSRVQAAEYVGVSASTFDKLVTDGDMPAPKRIRGRVVWDLKEVDRAFESLSEGDGNPWD